MSEIQSDSNTNTGWTLRYLLFQEHMGPENEPLFKGTRDLAEQIASVSGHKIQAESVYTKLSPILNGKKAVTEDFEKLMLLAVRGRLHHCNEETRQDLLDKIKKSLNDTEARQQIKNRNDLGFNKRLGEVSSKSKLRLLIPHGYTNPRTGSVSMSEVETEETRAGTAALFLQGCNLIGPDRGKPSSAKFISLYKSRREVLLFWEILFKVLIGEASVDPPVKVPYSLEEAADALERLDQEAVVQFYVVSPCYCFVPIVLYDPDQYDNCHAFLLYFKGGRLDPYEIPKENTVVWQNFFRDFMAQIYASYYSGNNGTSIRFDKTDKPEIYVQGWLESFKDFVKSAEIGDGGQERRPEFDMKTPQRILFEAGRAGFIQYAEMYSHGVSETVS